MLRRHCHAAYRLNTTTLSAATSCSWLLPLLLLLLQLSAVTNGAGAAKETSEFVKGKICIGTNGRMSVPSNREHHYRNLQNRYTNCTYVDGNLELTWLQDENLDLSFLQYIREVTGYVLISHVDVRRITLPRLQIIRGRTLFKLNIHEKEFALIVTLSKMHNLEMPALRDILTGSVGMFNNYNLCHMKTIKWDEIITGPGSEYVYVYNFSLAERECPKCHKDCAHGCWGEGADNCQKFSKINCSPQCYQGRCFGPNPRECCHLFCAGGCTGPKQSDCLACRNFYDDGVCTQECPAMQRYNPTTYSWEANPYGKYAYGATCVKNCPEHLLKDNGACVRMCPPKKKALNGECVPCDGPCPKTCEGVDGGLIHSGNINDFKDCTIIEGSISILDQSFKGFQQVYHNYSFGERYQKMHPDSLEIFSTLKEVTGYINIQGDHPDFTNLTYFRNLEVIGGRQLTEYFASLYIVKTSLRSLGLRALKKVHSGSVAILENRNLCFAQGIDWNLIKKSQEHTLMLHNNKHDDQCKKEGLVCDPQCSAAGCWGPGPDQCLACKNYQLGTTCLPDCDSVSGMYKAGGQMCMPCHEECESTCHGPGPDKCTRCRHVKDGPFCVQKCPDSKYNASGECRPCHANCIGGCQGPENTIGPNGCKSCEKAFINDNITVEHCLQKNESCPDGYYHEWVGPQEQGRLQPLAGKGVCRKCHPRCRKCTNYGFHIQVCQECAQYKRGEQCEDECPSDHFAHEMTQECKPCSVECRGCFGPDNSHCLNCRNYKIYVSGGVGGGGGGGDNTTRFNCTATCPPEYPHKIFPEDNGEPYCSVEAQGLAFLPRDAENIPTILAVVVACAVILLLFLLALLYQWRQRAKAKENAVKMSMVLQGLDEPLSPTNVKPNLTKLRIIKEHELRKGGVLGYGAFGTVYKGVWVPEGENIKIPVAIKVLRECTGAESTKEFLEEAYIMVTVVHPNLLQLLAVCLTSEMMLVTQLMPLGCLLDYVRSNKDKIGSKPLLNWCTQIARGMAYLEEKRLVHRDLAARNVLVQTPNCVKVTDFGLAKLLDINEDQYKAAGGKMPIKWLALECIQHRIFTHKSDVWAFGVTVWELLTYGGRPYESVPARDVPELLETGERLPQPNICTIDLYMLMINCWMLDAESRPSFKELADQFAKMARDPGRYLVIPGDKFMRLPSYSSQEDKEMITMDASDGCGGAATPAEDASGFPHAHAHPHAKNSLYPSVVLLESPGPQNQANWDREMMRPTAAAGSAASATAASAAAAAASDPHANPLRYCVDPLTRDCMEFAGSSSKREAQVLGDLKLDLPLDEDDYLMPSPQQTQPTTTYMDLIGEANMQGDLASAAASRMAAPPIDRQEFLPSVDNPEYHMVAVGVGLPHVNGLPNADTVGLPEAATNSAPVPPHKSSEEESDHEYYNDYDRLKRELQPLRRNETTV